MPEVETAVPGHSRKGIAMTAARHSRGAPSTSRSGAPSSFPTASPSAESCVSSRRAGEAPDSPRALCQFCLRVSDSETSGVPAADGDRGTLCRGVEQLVARDAHNVEVSGSSPDSAIPSVPDQRPAPHTDLCGAFTHRWRLPTAISERELMRAYGGAISILVLGALTACGIACSWGVFPW